IGGRHPDRAAAMLPVVLAIFPGLVARLADTRDRVGAPRLLAGVEIGGIDPAADAEFAAGRSDDGGVADDQRRQRHRLAQRRLRTLALPPLLAGVAVDGEDASVEGDRDDLVLPQRDTAVVDAAAGDVACPHAVDAGIELPFDRTLAAAADVDGVDRAPA